MLSVLAFDAIRRYGTNGKLAVVTYGKDLVGYCCLDAPWQETNEFWGAAVSHRFSNLLLLFSSTIALIIFLCPSA